MKTVKLVGGPYDGIEAPLPANGGAIKVEAEIYTPSLIIGGPYRHDPQASMESVLNFRGYLSAQEVNIALANALLTKHGHRDGRKVTAERVDVTFSWPKDKKNIEGALVVIALSKTPMLTNGGKRG